MNKNKFLVPASIIFLFFVFAAAFAFALQGSSSNYQISDGIQGLGGSQGSSTNYGAGATLDFIPSGTGASANYGVCLGAWCEEAQTAPCNPPDPNKTGEKWVIPPLTTVVCKDQTIDMPLNGNLSVEGTLVFNRVVFNMNPNANGNANITVEKGGVFTTQEVGVTMADTGGIAITKGESAHEFATQTPPHTVIRSGSGNAYMFHVYGGVNIANSEIRNVGYRSNQRKPYELGMYFKDAGSVVLVNNIISETIYGVVLENTNNAQINGNKITTFKPSSTVPVAVYMMSASKNSFSNNEFINNDISLSLQTSNENKFTSNVFTNTAMKTFSGSSTALNNIILDSDAPKPIETLDSSNATREWFHNVHVKNAQGEDIGYANVTITPKYLYTPASPTFGGVPPFHGQIVTRNTSAKGLTPIDEAIQYDQNAYGENELYYDPYNVTACAVNQNGEKICNWTLTDIDESKTTEIVLDVPVNFGCDIPKVEPQNIYYPPNGRNKVTVTFDQDIQVGQEGSFTCGVRDITTPFVVAANRSFVFDCPEGTENYPDGEQSYAAVATIRVKPGELPAYCSNTTYVWAAQGQTPTPTPTPTPTSTVRPTGGPTTYPSDVSFLSASCPTSLVLSNETSVNAFLVIKGQPTCPDSGAPVPGGGVWKFFVTRPSGQKLQEFAPFSCAQGTTVFTLATDAEGAYVIDITADTDALPPEQRVGELSSSCNFRVFRRPPSKFPELPLAFVALIFVALFVYLSRYSRYSEKRSKKPE